MLHCFVEGPDDETFFKQLFCCGDIYFYQIAHKSVVKVNQYLKSLKQMKEPYIFFVDADGDKITDKTSKILLKYSELETDYLYIVQFEIESWLLAGVDKSFGDKNKFKKYYLHTDNVTKEMFLRNIESTRETKLNIVLKILSVFDSSLAETRNESFRIFYNKNRSICK